MLGLGFGQVLQIVPRYRREQRHPVISRQVSVLQKSSLQLLDERGLAHPRHAGHRLAGRLRSSAMDLSSQMGQLTAAPNERTEGPAGSVR